MFTMEKRATGADRARKRIHVPGEALVPTFTDGTVRVTATRRSSIHALRRKGYHLVKDAPKPKPKPKPKPPVLTKPPALAAPTPSKPPATPASKPERQVELEAGSVKLLRALARELGIKGRSGMGEADLVSAIIDAEA